MIIYYKNREEEGFAVVTRESIGGWPIIRRQRKEIALNPDLTEIREATDLEKLAFNCGAES